MVSEHAPWPGPGTPGAGTASLQKGGSVAAAGYKRHKLRALTSRKAFGQYDYYSPAYVARLRSAIVRACIYTCVRAPLVCMRS
jgi:hypothetical protein